MTPHPMPTFNCAQCPVKVEGIAELIAHLQAEHPPAPPTLAEALGSLKHLVTCFCTPGPTGKVWHESDCNETYAEDFEVVEAALKRLTEARDRLEAELKRSLATCRNCLDEFSAEDVLDGDLYSVVCTMCAKAGRT